MYYTIYKTINLKNKKIYIGYHVTKDPNDSYLGSGKLLKLAINKYGIKNFKKEILFIFDNKKEMIKKEIEIVNEKFITKHNNYNIKIGGKGGWEHILKLIKIDPIFSKKIKENQIKGLKKAYKEGRKIGWSGFNGQGFPNGMKGKHHSLESKKIISKNSAQRIPKKETKKRLNDFNEIEKKRGWINELSKKWKISHTQVRRFINKI